MSVISSNLNAIVLTLFLDMDTPHLDNVEKYKRSDKTFKNWRKKLEMCRVGLLF